MQVFYEEEEQHLHWALSASVALAYDHQTTSSPCTDLTALLAYHLFSTLKR